MKVDSVRHAVSIFAQQDWDAGPNTEPAQQTGAQEMAVAEPGRAPGMTAWSGGRGAWLRRHEWARGYLLMSPTIMVMVAMFIAPLVAVVAMSFWTQHLLEIDRTPTLANYGHLVEPSAPGEEVARWM